MDSKHWYRATKAVDLRSIPGIPDRHLGGRFLVFARLPEQNRKIGTEAGTEIGTEQPRIGTERGRISTELERTEAPNRPHD